MKLQLIPYAYNASAFLIKICFLHFNNSLQLTVFKLGSFWARHIFYWNLSPTNVSNFLSRLNPGCDINGTL